MRQTLPHLWECECIVPEVDGNTRVGVEQISHGTGQTKRGAGGIDPCAGRSNAGSWITIAPKNPSGHVVRLGASNTTASPSRRIDTRSVLKRNSSGKRTAW